MMMDVNQMTADIKNETHKQAKPLEKIDQDLANAQ
jgi:hypothetical protein